MQHKIGLFGVSNVDLMEQFQYGIVLILCVCESVVSLNIIYVIIYS